MEALDYPYVFTILYPRSCEECNSEFLTEIPSQKYCCRKCNKSFRDRRRRAIKKTVFIEDVSLGDVFNKSKGICQLCQMPVDRSINHPDMACGTVDHIIPISLGGPHSLPNCQLAHLHCNTAKNNRVGLTKDQKATAKAKLKKPTNCISITGNNIGNKCK